MSMPFKMQCITFIMQGVHFKAVLGVQSLCYA
jgi:hypothetical protein